MRKCVVVAGCAIVCEQFQLVPQQMHWPHTCVWAQLFRAAAHSARPALHCMSHMTSPDRDLARCSY